MKRRELLLGGALTTLSTLQLACGTKAPEATPEKAEANPMYSSSMIPATFIGGNTGKWRVARITGVRGDSLPKIERLEVGVGLSTPTGASWSLRGVTSHARYVERREKTQLDASSPALGRAEASHAALIPIKKSAAWWALTQDERRDIFEERSRHITDSMKYLPRIARRLYHARELGEPFDFLTWFEFAPEHSQAFDELLALLRSREEWTFVEREVELRLEP